jgi:hypothetical protein
MWTAGGSTKLIESDEDEVGWPGELRGEGLLLRLDALLQSLVPAIVACGVDLADRVNQLHRPPQPQCGQLRTATRPDGALPGRPETEQVFTSSSAARTSIDSWAWRSWKRMQIFRQRMTSEYVKRLKRHGG